MLFLTALPCLEMEAMIVKGKMKYCCNFLVDQDLDSKRYLVIWDPCAASKIAVFLDYELFFCGFDLKSASRTGFLKMNLIVFF